MKLITKAIEKKLEKAGYDGDKPICKFFNPCGAATWIIFGRDEENPDILFGVADLGFGLVEAGTISLSELQNTKLMFGLGIERDLHFYPDEELTLKDFLGLESLSRF